jgi:hypothetical protein
MTTELKGNSMKPNSEESLLMDMQCTIERLENELLAAIIRIDNDARTIASLTQERDAAIVEPLEQAHLFGIDGFK